MAPASTEEQAVVGYQEAQDRCLQEYRVEAESRFVPISTFDGPAHVLATGEGAPLVMIAAPGPAALWAPLMARLDGFSMYAIDGPGFGLTNPVTYETDRLRSLAIDFLVELLDQLELPRATFVANSIGGLWTIWFALDQPHRVDAVALVGAPSMLLETKAPLPERLLSIPLFGRLMMRLQPPSSRQVDRLFAMMNEDISDQPAIRDLMLMCEQLPAFTPSFLAFLHSTVGMRGSRPEMRLTTEQLEQLTQPVQLIWGENEPAGPRQLAERAAEAIPDSELHFLPAGHIPWLGSPREVGKLIVEFLSDHSPNNRSD